MNTTAYHPQTDELAEHFNITLTDMLAKRVEQSGRDWNANLPFVLFAYRASLQELTKELPFYLLYGCGPRLPTILSDRVFVYMPATKACEALFARLCYEPYRIVGQSETGVVVHPVDQPQAYSIRVAYNRIRRCADSAPDVFLADQG